MLRFTWTPKLEEIKDGGTGAMPVPPNATPVVTPAPAAPAASGGTPPEGEGDNLDELGYEKVAAPVKEGEEKTPVTPPVTAAKGEPIKDPVSGYTEEPPVPLVEPPPPVPIVKVELGYELDMKGLGPKEINDLQDFMKKNNVTKEVAQAFVNKRLGEVQQIVADRDAQVKAQAKQVAETRSNWHKELKADPTFGGENFAANVQQVEKFVDEFMPDLKKELTKTKSVMPPYIMRGFRAVAEKLYGTEKLVQGEPAPPPKPVAGEHDFLDDMYQ